MATKAAIVTGGAQGIGKAISGVLLRQGYKVGVEKLNEPWSNKKFKKQKSLLSCLTK